MGSRTTQLMTTVVAAVVLTATAPAVAGAGQPGAAMSRSEAVAPTVTTTFDTVDVALHHHGDPRQGTVQLRLSMQTMSSCLADPSPGLVQMRTIATLTKVDHAVRVQIDAVDVAGGSMLESIDEHQSWRHWPVRRAASHVGLSVRVSPRREISMAACNQCLS